jgi:hypothetical protein
VADPLRHVDIGKLSCTCGLRPADGLGHMPSCKISQAVQLRKIQRDLRAMEELQVLPDPTLEALDRQKRKDLQRSCTRLLKSIGA